MNNPPLDISTPNTVLFLGAGFSKAIDHNAPLMCNFFDQVDDEQYPHLATLLRHLEHDTDVADVEKVLRCAGNYRDMPVSGECSAVAHIKNILPHASNDLDRYCIRRLQLKNDSVDSWAARLLAGAEDMTTVITTNYDTLAEQILSCRTGITHGESGGNCPHCNMVSILREKCDCTNTRVQASRWCGSLLKLHGSIAWCICENKNCNYYGCIGPDRKCMSPDLPCPCCGALRRPVLIHPSERKDYARFPNISRMWECAACALREAEQFMIFGMSLPDSDGTISEFIRSHLSTQLRRVAVIDLNPDDVASRLDPLLPRRDMQIELFKVDVKEDSPTWLVEAIG